MKITHCTHRDKWGISHIFASKRDSAEPYSTHNPSSRVNPLFWSTKGLAYDMYSYA
jgi:hypothetical protein